MSSKLSARQKSTLASFLQLVDAEESAAIKFLRTHKWDLEVAMDEFFEKPYLLQTVSPEKIYEFFSKYSENGEEINEDGFDKLMGDLAISEDDLVQFVIAWECNCGNLSVFTKKEFEIGMSKLSCDTLDKLKAKLPNLREKIKDPKTFKEFYNFMFGYAKGTNERKTLTKELAFGLWELLLPDIFPFWKEFQTFMTSRNKDISKDTWQQLLDFARMVKEDTTLSSYDPTAAWPVLIDDFVEYLREKNIVPTPDS